MLHWSALRGHRELMNLLLERGLDVNATRNVRLRRRSLTLLCEYGLTVPASCAQDGATPLFLAIQCGQAAGVTRLLDGGADIDATDGV